MLQIDGEAEKVPNKQVALHLSFVYPQDTSIFQNDEFKKLQIRGDWELADIKLNNLDIAGPHSDEDPETEDEKDSPIHRYQSTKSTIESV